MVDSPYIQGRISEPLADPGTRARLGLPKPRGGNPRRKGAANPPTSHAARGSLRQLTPADLRDWLRRLGLTVPIFAAALGRSEAVVYQWLAGEHKPPPYVTAWLELLSAFDKLARQYISKSELLALVLEFVREQPEGSDMPVERIAQRMALPVGVVKEAVERLIQEGVLR